VLHLTYVTSQAVYMLLATTHMVHPTQLYVSPSCNLQATRVMCTLRWYAKFYSG
jgi:hypothetical protein